MTSVAQDVEAYLQAVPEESRAALEKLRQTIRSVVPDATERISYRVPTFHHRGPLVGFAAFKSHCSFFVMSTSVMDPLTDELRAYDTSRGTIRFQPSKPLPSALVKKLVKARIAENEAAKTR